MNLPMLPDFVIVSVMLLHFSQQANPVSPFDEGELASEATVKECLTVENEGKLEKSVACKDFLHTSQPLTVFLAN
jgi:hypothetical protein